ncbi:MAG: CtsR family transcriptional regulator [Bacillota bacterium]|uniref:CtsR family transcriptional regulator n=1 Tax=Desulfurispora thermophila TaxID=265470 RepID=UPI00037D1BF9
MSNISNLIEKYLRELLERSRQNQIEIQRSELAEKFRCVPSQINYVLTTRFTLERGFVVESRRGGGGYVRIIRLPLGRQNNLLFKLQSMVGQEISQQSAEHLISRLEEEKLISRREAALMRAVCQREVLSMGLPGRDIIRANLIKAMLVALLQNQQRETQRGESGPDMLTSQEENGRGESSDDQKE